eukprot:s4066_g4.t1
MTDFVPSLALGPMPACSARRQRGFVMRKLHVRVLAASSLLSAVSLAVLTFVSPSSPSQGRAAARFCGQRPVPSQLLTPLAAASTLSWTTPSSSWSAERLSPREWLRMYRTLGLSQDATKAQVSKAASRLRKKYSSDEAALQRVEAANLWIMTKLLSEKEEALRAKQAANRLRELGDSPRRLFHKYVAGYVPPGVRQMIEPPTTKHFRWASGLLGAFALFGLCVPTQATNFIGLAAASAMGLVYQRNRPEPVKDDMGNVGAVQKPNVKEMGASIALVVIGAIVSAGLSLMISFTLQTDFQAYFCTTTCFVLWLIALFFKVYQCFDA